jgi:hypothetical protein
MIQSSVFLLALFISILLLKKFLVDLVKENDDIKFEIILIAITASLWTLFYYLNQ